ncbi:hypothetical protein D9M72_509810 [compost metagenome]
MRVDPVQQLNDAGFHALPFVRLAFVEEAGDQRACLLERLLEADAALARQLVDLAAGRHQLPTQGELAHDQRVLAHAGGAGHVLGQRVERLQADQIVFPDPLHLVVDREHVGVAAGVDQRADGAVDQSVLLPEKVAVGQQVAHAVPQPVVQQQRTQQRRLALCAPQHHRCQDGFIDSIVHSFSSTVVFSSTCFSPPDFIKYSMSGFQFACSPVRGVRPMRKSFSRARRK